MKKALRVLVTGSAGYIGSALVPALRKRGHDVVALDIRGDDSFDWDVAKGDLPLKGVDAVVPLAAIVGAKACDTDPQRAIVVNVESARTLSRALGNRRCVYLTTDSGYAPSDAAKESDAFKPTSIYAITKLEATFSFQGAGATVFRLASLFGPSRTAMRDDLLAHFLAQHVALQGKLPSISEPASRRAFVFLYDVIDAVIFALESPKGIQGRVFNLTSPDRITKGALARFTAKAAGIPGGFETDSSRDPDGRDFWLDGTAWADTNGPQPTTRLVDYLPWLLRYYQEVPR